MVDVGTVIALVLGAFTLVFGSVTVTISLLNFRNQQKK